MAGHTFQHLAGFQAHSFIVVPDTRAYCFPLVQRATVRALEVAPKAAGGYFSAHPGRVGCFGTTGGTPSGQ